MLGVFLHIIIIIIIIMYFYNSSSYVHKGRIFMEKGDLGVSME